jgi:signal transduction histidine kinase
MSLETNRGNRLTLTTSLSLFFLTTLALVLGGFSVTVYLLAGTYLHGQSDERLDASLNTLVAAIDVGPDGLEWEPTQRRLNLGPAAFGDQVLWLIGDDQGRIVDRSKQDIAEDFLAEAAERLRQSERSTKRLDWQGQRWQFRQRWIQAPSQAPAKRASTEPNQHDDGKRYPALSITAGVPLGPVQATLRLLAATLAGLSVAIWLAAMLAGRVVCRRALLPVTRMAATAREMDANNLEQRLPALATKDELEDLTRAFNSLLDRLRDSFERQQRFTGDASHQLRTPLAAILGQIEVALRRERSPEEYQRVLATVQRQAEHLRQITEALLFLARADTEARLPEREHLDLMDWLPEHLRGWSEHERAKDIHLECNLVGAAVVNGKSSGSATHDSPLTTYPSCGIEVQPALLGELLNILMDNACKYSPAGTPITIRLQREEQAVCVQVEDEGSGIAESDLPHLFTPFFRSAQTRRLGVDGFGLGLSIARRLAGAFGGALTVTSRIGHGSCFTLRLAAAATPQRAKLAIDN